MTGSRVPGHVPPPPHLVQTRSALARLEKQPPGANGVMDVPDVPPHTAPCGKKPLVRYIMPINRLAPRPEQLV